MADVQQVQLPEIPKPIDQTVVRYDADGRPTPDVVRYEQKLYVFLQAVKKALEPQ